MSSVTAKLTSMNKFASVDSGASALDSSNIGNDHQTQRSIRFLSTVMTDDQLNDCGLSVVKPEFGAQISSKFHLAKLINVKPDEVGNGDWLVKLDSILTENIAQSLNWENRIASRIATIREAAAEDKITLRQSSLDAAIEFLDNENVHLRPSVFLLDNGNIRLFWRNSNCQIGLQFLDEDKIQYVIIDNNESEHLGVGPHKSIVGIIAGLDLIEMLRS